MRWKNINLLGEKDKNTEMPEYNLTDRTTDPYLADKLGKLNKDDYRLAKEMVTMNPFFYLTLEKNIKGITTFDEFVIDEQNIHLSIGGLLVRNEIKDRQKFKIIKKQIKTWKNDYLDDQKGSIKDITKKMEILNDFDLPRLPRLMFIINIIFLIIILIVNFPPQKLGEFNFLEKFFQLLKTIKILKFLKIFSLITTFLSLAFLVIFHKFISDKEKQKNEMTQQVKVLGTNLEQKTNKLIKYLNKHYQRATKKAHLAKYAPLELTDLKKYQKMLNINHLVDDYLNNLSKIKKCYKWQKIINISLFILSNILIVLLIILLIINLIK